MIHKYYPNHILVTPFGEAELVVESKKKFTDEEKLFILGELQRTSDQSLAFHKFKQRSFLGKLKYILFEGN